MTGLGKDFCFATESVVSVSSVCQDQELKESIRSSDFIRNETMKRCCAIPSYQYKSLEWKNRYYSVIQRKVKKEVEYEIREERAGNERI